MNRPLLEMLLLSLAGGCAERTAEYYRASAPEGVVETKAQGCAGPTAIYSFPIADGVAGSIQAHPTQSGVGVSLSLSLKENRTVRLDASEVLIYDAAKTTARGIVTKFEISVFGRDGKQGQIETFGPQSELKGLNRNPMRQIASLGQVDTFRTVVQITAVRPESFTLQLPVLIANGAPVKIPPIQFGRREQTYVLACVQ